MPKQKEKRWAKEAFDELSSECRKYWGRFEPNMGTIDGKDHIPGCKIYDNDEGFIKMSEKLYDLSKRNPKLQYIVKEEVRHEGDTYGPDEQTSHYHLFQTETDGEKIKVELFKHSSIDGELRFYGELEVPTFLEDDKLNLENTVREFRKAKIFI